MIRSPESEAERKATALAWGSDFSGYQEEDFFVAMKAHWRESDFFPTPRQLIDRLNAAATNRQMRTPVQQIGYTPEDMTKEEIREIRKQNFPKLVAGIGRKI
ncbi:MAG: hypothetical protein M0P69_06010 [Bacteroidales bacterium]|nr:hypothetical protein [Bacteroidales bacterium]